MRVVRAAAAPRPETTRARSRVVASVVGAGASAVAGLLLVVVVTHGLDVVDAGRVLTGIALLTVLTAACCGGVDTGLIWLLPRLTDTASRRVVVRTATQRPLLLTTVVGGALAALTGPTAALVFPGAHGGRVVLVVAVTLPVLVGSTVLVAAVRGLDRLPLYLVLQFGVLPTGRLVGAGGVIVAGGLAAATLVGWAAAAVVSGGAAATAVWRATRTGHTLAPRHADRLTRRLWTFCRPRAVSSVIDASAGWVGVLLVAALAGSADAARFGTVSRCALAGLLVMQAVRVATATQFSALLRRGAVDGVGELYRATTRWVVLASWPVFGLLATYAGLVLSVFGEEYRSAAAALVVVAAAMAVNTGCGNAQTVLLMSGDSRRHLVATVAGLATTVVGDVLFVPSHGVLAAAVAWAAGIAVENLLVLGWLVTRLHLAVVDRSTLLVSVALLGVVLPLVVLVRLVAGPGWYSFLLAAVVAAAAVAVVGLAPLLLRGPGSEPGRRVTA
ncbi:lipopolysaccharide biosynthesis protein [Jatrophihabitans sp. YIM 134969]